MREEKIRQQPAASTQRPPTMRGSTHRPSGNTVAAQHRRLAALNHLRSLLEFVAVKPHPPCEDPPPGKWASLPVAATPLLRDGCRSIYSIPIPNCSAFLSHRSVRRPRAPAVESIQQTVVSRPAPSLARQGCRHAADPSAARLRAARPLSVDPAALGPSPAESV